MGLPSPLLSLFADKTAVSGRTVKYRIVTVPKKIELGGDCTYYNWETEVGGILSPVIGMEHR